MTDSDERGFTLVELIMVLVLVGILSVGATSLFSSRDAFTSFVAKNILVSGSLLAQQTALANQTSNLPASLTLSYNSTNKQWTFQVDKAGYSVPISSQQTDATGTSLTITRSDGTTMSLPLTLSWDRQANMSPRYGYTFRFSGQNPVTVCLSSAGYAYESGSGSCP
jgi:MSHA pilin protein MshC